MSEKKSIRNKTAEKNNQPVNERVKTKDGFQLPSLEQFMEIVSGERQTLTATASGYNVYNKYNKSS
jgi:hypothetical protein